MPRVLGKRKLTAAAASAAICIFAGASARASFLQYNVVATGTLTESSDIYGTTFVNNLITTNNKPTFDESQTGGSGDTLDVAGSVSGSVGATIDAGVFRHAGALPSDFQSNLTLNNGASQVTDPSVSISGVQSDMNNAASFYNTLTGTAPSLNGQTLNFNASGSGSTVFSVSASALQTGNLNVDLNFTSTSQTMIIIVSGGSFNFGNSEHLSISGGSATAAQVMWYFPGATTISLNDSQWLGSILATSATLSDNSQQMDGGVYVENFNQTAEVHFGNPSQSVGTNLFSGPVPEPATGALLAAAGLLPLAARRSSKR